MTSKPLTTAQMKQALAKFKKGTKAKERVYHGTSNLEALHSFDPAMTGKGVDQMGSGFYFTTHPEEASGYASMPNHPSYPKAGAGDSPGVMSAHLAIRKPIKLKPKHYSLSDANINMSHDQVKRIMAHAPNINHPDESPLGNHMDTSRGVTPKMLHDTAKLYTGNNIHSLENDFFPKASTAYRHALHNVLGYDGVMKDFGDGRKHYVAWFPEQIKSDTGNRGTYDPTNPDITKAQGGVVKLAKGGEPASMDAMKLALTQHGMYSPLEKATIGVNRTKGTPAEFMAEVSKQPGFRKEEVSDRRLQLPDQKLTKAEFMSHLQKSSAPHVTEHELHDFGDEDEALETAAQHLYGQSYDEVYDDKKARNKVDEYIKKHSSQYSTYQLPGAKNYREVLLQTPHFAEHDEHRMMELEADRRRASHPAHWGMATGEARELADLMKRKEGMGEQYHTSHFKGHPNVIAHMRMSDRMTPEGKKLLHLEEIQSDWHQEGRKKGYKDSAKVSKHKALEDRIQQLRDDFAHNRAPEDQLREEMMRLRKQQGELSIEDQHHRVPDAPFKKNWHELAVKHALHHAAKHGYHGLVITPGKEQADRYSLSKQVEAVRANLNPDGTYQLGVQPIGKNMQKHETSVKAEKLDELLGKELAEKIRSGVTDPGVDGGKVFSGLDLNVGGEGMKGFYDKIIPDYLNKLGKPHGVKVGKVPLEVKPAKSTPQIAAPGIGHFPEPIVEPAQHVQAHHFPITEPMRQQILQGQPMYKNGGIIHKAMGGAVQPNMAQMRFALNQQQLSGVGAEEAPNMFPKVYMPPAANENDDPSMGNSFDNTGMPIGGVDTSPEQPGQQLAPPPAQPPQGQQQPGQPPQGMPGAPGQPPMGAAQQGGLTAPTGPAPPMGNMLAMTPQGQTMQALGGGQPRPPGMAHGGVARFDNGGMASNVEDMRSELMNKYNPTAVKASEALGEHEGKTLKVTQADRTKVGDGFLGGPGFSSLQHVDPRYKDAAWGVNSGAAASKLTNASGKDVLFSTLIGAPNQHTSNQMVFDMLLKKFKSAIKAGKMPPELREAIKMRLAAAVDGNGKPIFGGNTDIASKNFFQGLNTFDQRRVMADLMGGNTVGGKKGQVFNYDKIVRDTTEPELLDAPTHAIGPRLFSLTGERSHKPDLHPAFPHILHGEDMGKVYHPVPREVMLPDFHEHIRNTKGRGVGFMDLTRNTPSQFLSEKFLTQLQKQGHKKGGGVKLAPTQDTMQLALTKKKAK